ncbi:MAG: hypothetical protein VB913_08330 [Rhodospirillales bacterium]
MDINDAVTEQIDAEYIEEAKDTVATLEIEVSKLRSEASSTAEAASTLLSESIKLQKLSHWANQPLIDLGVRRFIEYITDLDEPHVRQKDDIEAFVDVLRGILDGDIEKNTDQAEFVRSLPVRRPADLDDLQHLDIEILLVEPQRSSARILPESWQAAVIA